MKKQLIIVFAMALTGGINANAQTQLPAVDEAGSYTLFGNNSYYRDTETFPDGGFVNHYSQHFEGVRYSGSSFLRGNVLENETISGGSASIHLGDSSSPVLVNLKHNLSGRLYLVTSDTGIGNDVTIDASEKPESTITGSSSDYRFARDDNAITTYNWNSDGRQNNVDMTLIEGIYQGGAGYSGMVNIRNSGDLTIKGASFIAGSYSEGGGKKPTWLHDSNDWTVDNELKNYYAQAGAHVSISGNVVIDNSGGDNFDRFKGADFNFSTINDGGSENLDIDARGGDGLYAGARSVSITGGGEFIAGTTESAGNRKVNVTGFDTVSAFVNAHGGRGLVIQASGNNRVEDAKIYGGNASSITVGGENAYANSMGGEGLIANGTITITNVYARAGNSAASTVVPEGYWIISSGEDRVEATPSAENATVYSLGGSGMRLTGGTATIHDSTAIGTSGSSATANGANSAAYATGGHGVLAQRTTVIINGGTYTGARGGNVTVNGTGEADGGAGAYAFNNSLTINGGTFTGGAGGYVNGVAQTGNAGVWAVDAALTVTEDHSETEIKGDVIFDNATGKSLTIKGGTIGGDIYKRGVGLATVQVSSEATYSGAYTQEAGDTAVTLTSSDESKFFSDVNLQTGDMTFSGAQVLLADNARFTMGGSGNTLDFGTAGAVLGNGASISAGLNTVKTDGSLDLGDNSSIMISYDSQDNIEGKLTVGGDLFLTNRNTKIIAGGISSTPDGDFTVATVAGNIVGLTTSNFNEKVEVDFGWLTKSDTNKSSIVGGITAGYQYRSLHETSLWDLGDVLDEVDAAIIGLTNSEFYAINELGEADGDKLIRYPLSQLPDVSESSFQISQQLNKQIAARGTEFRSMNGFASTKPRFGNTVPVGVAGPQNEVNSEKTMQGWVRAYGSKGSMDSSGKFSDYDSSSWGTVIGVDKSFGNLLIGLAGGYARSDLDAGSAYQANVDTYHGSVYSTIGGESLYIDLALTYGSSKAEENNKISSGSFDSDLFSAYIGAGYNFDVGEKIAITPEASLLASFYQQDAYDRTMSMLGSGTIDEYDTSSYLGSIGLNFATQHQMDWLNRGIAFIPEVRTHYIHEFNADPDNFTVNNATGSFAVRPREENMFRLGFGLDMWSWKYQSTKFEIDYDALFSDTYFEHVLSGKITWRF